jgi:hypothetical protein
MIVTHFAPSPIGWDRAMAGLSGEWTVARTTDDCRAQNAPFATVSRNRKVAPYRTYGRQQVRKRTTLASSVRLILEKEQSDNEATDTED